MFVYQPPQTPYLSILHQDDDILVLDKPSGLLSVPGKAEEHKDSLANRVCTVYPLARVVHRLDMATSGIIVMAKHKEAQAHLNRQFQQRVPKKHYEAIVKGEIQQDSGSIELPLICDWPNRPKQMVDHERGKPALTHWRVIERLEDASRVELFPVTGRSHQLRVHMLSIGHVILGDRLYADQHSIDRVSRLQLHAKYLAFYHPSQDTWLEFHSTTPF